MVWSCDARVCGHVTRNASPWFVIFKLSSFLCLTSFVFSQVRSTYLSAPGELCAALDWRVKDFLCANGETIPDQGFHWSTMCDRYPRKMVKIGPGSVRKMVKIGPGSVLKMVQIGTNQSKSVQIGTNFQKVPIIGTNRNKFSENSYIGAKSRLSEPVETL